MFPHEVSQQKLKCIYIYKSIETEKKEINRPQKKKTTKVSLIRIIK